VTRSKPPRGRDEAASALAYEGRPWLKSYPDDVPPDATIPDVPLTRLLDDAAASFPTRTAMTFLGVSTSYRELRVQVDRFAGSLASLGVGAGDRVALVLPNCPQYVIAFFAALRLGAVVVPLNPLGTEEELVRQFADARPAAVVCLDKTFSTVVAARSRTPVPVVIVTSALDFVPALQRAWLRVPLNRNRRRRAELSQPVSLDADAHLFIDLLRRAHAAGQRAVDPTTAVAVLIYTGGTSGVPRAAKLTHRNLVANAYQVRLWYADARSGQEVTLTALPLSHAYGLTLCLTATTLLAGTLVLLPRWNLDEALAAIDEYRPTLFPGVPPIYEALVASPKTRSHDLRSIRACVSGAMRLPPETQEQFQKVTGGRLVEGYGMTETSPVTHANPLDGRGRPGSIGLPLPSTRCRLVDPEDPERAVPPGEPGELAVAGPQVFAGYWHAGDDEQAPTDAARFTSDGFYLTGDVAVMDADGFFTIVERKKELIIAGGFNIYPLEVEEVLVGHPRIADACVVGVPDRYRGETVKAYVVLTEPGAMTVADVIDHCSHSLTAYKVPRRIEFRDELPRTALGKIQRHLLKEQAASDAEGERA
jgi:long-chain acyl-CoA synthetase